MTPVERDGCVEMRDTLDQLLHAAEGILAELRHLRRTLPKAEPAADPFELAQQLRAARAATGLSLRALEAEIGVPFNCLSRVERGVGLASGVNERRIREWLAGRRPAPKERAS
jgi:hypothetical protein